MRSERDFSLTNSARLIFSALLFLVSPAFAKSFYTVQGPSDATRMMTVGGPWPGGDERAALGPGVYAFDNIDSARAYLKQKLSGLSQRGVREPALSIIEFSIPDETLAAWKKEGKVLRVSELTDVQIDKFMTDHSLLYNPEGATEHSYFYIERPGAAEFGSEHVFNKAIYETLREWKVVQAADPKGELKVVRLKTGTDIESQIAEIFKGLSSDDKAYRRVVVEMKGLTPAERNAAMSLMTDPKYQPTVDTGRLVGIVDGPIDGEGVVPVKKAPATAAKPAVNQTGPAKPMPLPREANPWAGIGQTAEQAAQAAAKAKAFALTRQGKFAANMRAASKVAVDFIDELGANRSSFMDGARVLAVAGGYATLHEHLLRSIELRNARLDEENREAFSDAFMAWQKQEKEICINGQKVKVRNNPYLTSNEPRLQYLEQGKAILTAIYGQDQMNVWESWSASWAGEWAANNVRLEKEIQEIIESGELDKEYAGARENNRRLVGPMWERWALYHSIKFGRLYKEEFTGPTWKRLRDLEAELKHLTHQKGLLDRMAVNAVTMFLEDQFFQDTSWVPPVYYLSYTYPSNAWKGLFDTRVHTWEVMVYLDQAKGQRYVLLDRRISGRKVLLSTWLKERRLRWEEEGYRVADIVIKDPFDYVDSLPAKGPSVPVGKAPDCVPVAAVETPVATGFAFVPATATEKEGVAKTLRETEIFITACGNKALSDGAVCDAMVKAGVFTKAPSDCRASLLERTREISELERYYRDVYGVLIPDTRRKWVLDLWNACYGRTTKSTYVPPTPTPLPMGPPKPLR